MTPKEKAKELVDKFTVVGLQRRNEGIQCALIAVDEILKEMSKVCVDHLLHNQVIYWEEVKSEIQKL